jgi:hypothetical protein
VVVFVLEVADHHVGLEQTVQWFPAAPASLADTLIDTIGPPRRSAAAAGRTSSAWPPAPALCRIPL